LSRLYYVSDARGDTRFSELDLPLCVGGTEHGDVVLPDLPAAAVVAHIGLSDGHAFVQPADDASALFHNHERLRESKWLKSGDQLQLGHAMLDWMVKGDQVYITAHRQGENPAPVPSGGPPQGPETPNSGPAEPETPAPRRLRRRLLFAAFLVLILAAGFVLIATPVRVRLTPPEAQPQLSGFPPPLRLGDRWLAWPGTYRVSASYEGYRPLDRNLVIPFGEFRELRFRMDPLPGRVHIEVEPEVKFRLRVDGKLQATSKEGVALIDRGEHRLRVETERYLPAKREVEILGLDRSQTVAFELKPGWGELRISSRPSGAEVRVDGRLLGMTPLSAELMRGQHTLELSLPRYKSLRLEREMKAGAILKEDAQLEPADGQLRVHSDPPGATVRVDGEFQGITPLTLSLASRTTHRLRLTRAGFEPALRQIALAPEQAREISVSLSPEYGVVFVAARPADATLLVDGESVGMATRRLRLPTRPHVLELRRAGYATERLTVTPRAGVTQQLEVTLSTLGQARAAATPAMLTTGAGQRLRLVRPEGEFRMGASRREAGRRANESQRLVKLTRPFYMGATEVTNAEFRRFRASHDSGTAEGSSLNGDTQPVVNVSWEDAARYCNWLSDKDGLPAAYVEQDGELRPVQPATTGYRLPSEAEWVYVARVLGRENLARYPWKGDYPPKVKAGNFADARVSDSFADVVPGYDDGYRVSAPVGGFPARPEGFYDLGGNVAEWTGDYYAVYPGEAERLATDPTGPQSGEHHVVRDSSWRQGSITELRLSYRDYSRTPRNDLGFRIARFAE
jgi:formylglycine-generating enzyme required for sulfatase activity